MYKAKRPGAEATLALLSALCVTLGAQACSRAPKTAVVPVQRIENAENGGSGDTRARDLRRRLARDPDDLDSRILLARMYAERGQPELAVEHYRFALNRFPDSTTSAVELAKTLREMDESLEASKVVRQALDHHPEGSWELQSIAGILLDEQGKFEAAEVAHREALRLAPERAALHNNLGYNLLLQGQGKEARAQLEQAIAIEPRMARAHNNLAAAFAVGDFDSQALAEWKKAGSAAAAHNNLAAVFIQQERYDDARTEIQASLSAERNYPPALANLKLLQDLHGQPVALQNKKHVNFARRVASTFGTVLVRHAAPSERSADKVADNRTASDPAVTPVGERPVGETKAGEGKVAQ